MLMERFTPRMDVDANIDEGSNNVETLHNFAVQSQSKPELAQKRSDELGAGSQDKKKTDPP